MLPTPEYCQFGEVALASDFMGWGQGCCGGLGPSCRCGFCQVGMTVWPVSLRVGEGSTSLAVFQLVAVDLRVGSDADGVARSPVPDGDDVCHLAPMTVGPA